MLPQGLRRFSLNKTLMRKRRPVPKALLLDLDGVLVDTVFIHAEAHRRAGLAHDLLLTPEELEAQRGMLSKEFYEGVLRDRGRPIDEAEVIAKHKEQEAAQIASRQPVRACPGATEIVDSALSRNVRVAVVSSASKENVERRLREAGLWDSRLVVVSAENVARGKPAPDPYAEGMTRIQVDPGECIAVEDAESGVQSAKAAGVYCVGVGDRQHPQLQQADEIVSDLRELVRSLGWRRAPAR